MLTLNEVLNMTTREARAVLTNMNTVGDIQNFIEGEHRITIIQRANSRINGLLKA
jgi:hypothetical protein